MTRELSAGPKVHTKRSLVGEIKYTFKVIITELYFDAMETNREPEKLLILSLNMAYFRDKLYLLPNLFLSFNRALDFALTKAGKLFQIENRTKVNFCSHPLS